MHKNVLYQLPNKILISDEDMNSMSSLEFSEKIIKISKRRVNYFQTNSNNLLNKPYSYYLYKLSNKMLYKNYNKYKGQGWYNINCIIKKLKSHYFTKYKEEIFLERNDTEYLKKYYNFKESIEIIPHKEKYYKHLSDFFERPMYNSIFYNKIRRRKAFAKLNIYKTKKLQSKSNFNKKDFEKRSSYKSDNENIVFNKDTINIIENYSKQSQKEKKYNKYNKFVKYSKSDVVHNLNNKQKKTIDTDTLKLSGTEEDLLPNKFFIDDSSLTLIIKNLSVYSKKKIGCFHKSPIGSLDSYNTSRNNCKKSSTNSQILSNSNTTSMSKRKNNNVSHKKNMKKNNDYYTIKINEKFNNKISNNKNKEHIIIFNLPTYTVNSNNYIISPDERVIKKSYSSTNKCLKKNISKNKRDKINDISKILFTKRLKNKEKQDKLKIKTKNLLIKHKSNSTLAKKKPIVREKKISLITNPFPNHNSSPNIKFVSNIFSYNKLSKKNNIDFSIKRKIYSLRNESSSRNHIKIKKNKKNYDKLTKRQELGSFDKKDKYKTSNFNKGDISYDWKKFNSKCDKIIGIKKLLYGKKKSCNKKKYNNFNIFG